MAGSNGDGASNQFTTLNDPQDETQDYPWTQGRLYRLEARFVPNEYVQFRDIDTGEWIQRSVNNLPSGAMDDDRYLNVVAKTTTAGKTEAFELHGWEVYVGEPGEEIAIAASGFQ